MSVRVIQWATGAMGRACLRAVLDHPDLRLVGLYAYDPAKIGRDAGALVKRADTGVLAVGEIAAICAIPADVVIHAARLAGAPDAHDADLVRLLQAGLNVITINGHTCPQHWSPARRARFEMACRLGGSRLMGAGLNPGFGMEKLAVAATGMCQRVTQVRLHEAVDCRAVRSPDYVFDMLGFGADPDRIDPNDPTWPPAAMLDPMYAEAIANAAAQLGLDLTEIVSDHCIRAATEDLHIAAGVIARGTASQIDWRWRGRVEGRDALAMDIAWFMETAHLADPTPPLWTIEITGAPNVRMRIELERPEGVSERTSAEQMGLAACVVNAIPGLLRLPPGLHPAPPFAPFAVKQI